MKKKHLLLLLGSLLLGGLIGMFGGYLYESSFKHFSRASTVYFDDHLFLSGNTIDNSSSLFYHE